MIKSLIQYPLIFLIISLGLKVEGQKCCYTQSDSIEIYRLLDHIDQLDLEGQMDSALKQLERIELLTRDQKFTRGLGFTLLKRADVLLKMEGAIPGVLTLCGEGIRIGRELNDFFLTGLGHHQSGQYYRDRVIYDSAIIHYQVAESQYHQMHDLNYLGLIENDLAFVYEKKGEYAQAIDHNLKALTLLEQVGNNKEMANTMGNLGAAYFRLGNKPKAIELFKQSATLRETIKDIKGLAATYGNLATAYNTISLDSSIHYQLLALENAKMSGVIANLAQANANASSLLSRQKNFTKAIEYENEAIRLYTQMGEKSKVANRLIALALLSKFTHDSAAAEKHFFQSERIAKELNNKPILPNLYLQKSIFYKEYGNFKSALENSDQYYSFKDSLLNEKTLGNIAQLQTKYETEKKDIEISRLNAEQKVKDLQLQNQQELLRTKYLQSLNQQSQIKLLQQENLISQNEKTIKQDELNRKMEENKFRETVLNQERLMALSRAKSEKTIRNISIAGAVLLAFLGWFLFNRYQLKQRIKSHERILSMRNTISKDLHDEIGSTLTSIAILSQSGQKTLSHQPHKVQEMLTSIADQSKSIQQNLSDIVWAIRPDTDRTESLFARIREYTASTLEPENIICILEADDVLLSKSLSELMRKEVLLIMKESINNIVKHADASEVKINALTQGNQLIFTISDNGTWKSKKDSTGTGLASMQERARKIGGSITWDHNSRGTIITLQVPFAG